MSFQIKGLKELERKFNRMEAAAEKLDGQMHQVAFESHELFHQKFLDDHTDFVNFADFELKTKDLNLHETVEFIKQHTKFNTCQEMIDMAVDQVEPHILQQKINQVGKSVWKQISES
jgi:hypothetical protein